MVFFFRLVLLYFKLVITFIITTALIVAKIKSVRHLTRWVQTLQLQYYRRHRSLLYWWVSVIVPISHTLHTPHLGFTGFSTIHFRSSTTPNKNRFRQSQLLLWPWWPFKDVFNTDLALLYVILVTIVGDWGNQCASHSRTDCFWFVWTTPLRRADDKIDNYQYYLSLSIINNKLISISVSLLLLCVVYGMLWGCLLPHLGFPGFSTTHFHTLSTPHKNSRWNYIDPHN